MTVLRKSARLNTQPALKPNHVMDLCLTPEHFYYSTEMMAKSVKNTRND